MQDEADSLLFQELFLVARSLDLSEEPASSGKPHRPELYVVTINALQVQIPSYEMTPSSLTCNRRLPGLAAPLYST